MTTPSFTLSTANSTSVCHLCPKRRKRPNMRVSTFRYRASNCVPDLPSKRARAFCSVRRFIKGVLCLLLSSPFLSVLVGGTQTQQGSTGPAKLVSGARVVKVEQKAKSARGLSMAQAGLAEYTGEFYRVGGRKIQLLRSLEKVAVLHLPSQDFSVRHTLQTIGTPHTSVSVDYEMPNRNTTVVTTSTLESLEDLTESIHLFGQMPGITRAVPVYIHEESGLELIVTDEFVVRLAEGTSFAQLETINEVTGATLVRPLGGTNDQFILAVPDSAPKDLLATCEFYCQQPGIEWAEPDFLGKVVKCGTQPNDPYYDFQWYLQDIEVPQAWDFATGSDQITIAVIGGGVDLSHEDLAGSLFANPGEIPGNGRDDDHNGYVDDNRGWDFYDGDNEPDPDVEEDDHGTAVAGIAAAVGNNAVGISGCAFGCKVMPVKVWDGFYYGTFSEIAQGILYASGFARNGSDSWRGADILNISLDLSCANCLDDALAKAAASGRGGKGCAIFCSAGNCAAAWDVAWVWLASGEHTIRWEYVKDASGSAGADTIWLDAVSFPDGYTEGFESGILPDGWSTGGDAEWTNVQDGVGGNHALTGWDGPRSRAMRGGAIAHGESSYLQVRRSVEEGYVTFGYWVSTEQVWDDDTDQWKHDALHVTVDGLALELETVADVPYIRTSIGYPASHADTIAVGANTDFGYRSDYSCYGPGLDFVAPSDGGLMSIWTTYPTLLAGGSVDNYGELGGTSSASALAAGVAALVLSKNPALTSSEVREIMRESCDQIGEVTYEAGWNKYYGHGRINAQLALEKAGSSTLKLTASDGGAGDFFGHSVAISGDYTIIGAPCDNNNGSQSGSAYIFKRQGTSWTQDAKLMALGGAAGDRLGNSVSISGDYAIVGAPSDYDSGGNSGAAYIFKREGTSWIQQQKLIATNDASIHDKFGWSVSISRDYAIVGELGNNAFGGSAYVFRREGTSWSQQAKLIGSDGAADNCFGCSVAISGDYAIVGAWGDSDNEASRMGSAYIFRSEGTSWTQRAKLVASDFEADDRFGYSVSISADYAIVGAHEDDDRGSDSGSAYVFKRTGTGWTQQAKLVASDGEADDWFAASVAISGNYAIVGAWGDTDNGIGSGSAYVFMREGASWTQQAKLTASDGTFGDYFGASVSISGGYAIVGALGDDSNGSNSGSAHIVRLSQTDD